MDLPELKTAKYEGEVFRNIYTCAPSQDLLEDICDFEDAPFLDALIQLTSEIDHEAPQAYRPFQYGKIQDQEILAVFKKEKWGYSRFSDGTDYGVWYSAEDEMTSIYEASWWAYQLGKDNVHSKGEVYTTDRMMYQCSLKAEQMVDLSLEQNFYSSLTHPHDYRFCHAIGRQSHQQGVHLLRTPSARKKNGICVPVFQAHAIQSAEKIFYMRFHINIDGMIAVSSSRKKFNFSFQHSIVTF